MKNHPIADVWPMMDEAKIQELADDIRKNGQLVPVWIYEGKILDGRNRWAACKIAGIEPKTQEYTGDEPTAFAVSLNDRRRHMNKGSLAAVAAELEPHFAADAKRRQKQAGVDHGRGQKVTQKVEQPIGKNERTAAAESAASVGVNRQYVTDAKKVKADAPEVFQRLKAGTITLQDAKREAAKKPTDDWSDSELLRQVQVKSGVTVVANASADKNLIQWAEGQGLAVRIDRGTRYGNPFIMGEDGDRQQVCDAFEHHYLYNKPSIISRIRRGELSGKVLVCHCYPEMCHGDCMADNANGQ
jgi:ParB-like chromosome segregation protein Spo0J